MIETNLTSKDVALVAIGGALTSWVGETIPLIIVSNGKIPFNGPFESKIYLCNREEDVSKLASEIGGIRCLSFITPKIKELISEHPKG